jgi:drug/metabolite transporter (DMT)-like permease
MTHIGQKQKLDDVAGLAPDEGHIQRPRRMQILMKIFGGLVAALTWYLFFILAKSYGPVNRIEDFLSLLLPVVPLVLVLWAAMRSSERGEQIAAVWLLAAAPVVSVLAVFCFFAAMHSITE